ncbi:MAG: hypothetical protein ACLRWQ_01525 [Flavonifractor plautii]
MIPLRRRRGRRGGHGRGGTGRGGGLPPAGTGVRPAGRGAGRRAHPARTWPLLCHPRGRKGGGRGGPFRCVLNKADTPERAAHACAEAGRLAERGIQRHYLLYGRGAGRIDAGSDQGSGRSGHRHGGAAVPGGHTGGHDGGGPAHGGASDGGLLPVHVRRRGPGGGDSARRADGPGRPAGRWSGGRFRALRSGGGHVDGAAL